MSDLTNELISGKDALIALVNGKDVQYRTNSVWREITKGSFESWDLAEFLINVDYDFRLKPNTITLKGVEIPAPFKPKDGEFFYCLSPSSDSGYSFNTNKIFSQYGAWRTEDQIKQVVAALRNVFGGNK